MSETLHKNDSNRPACKPGAKNWRDYKYASANGKVNCLKCIIVWNAKVRIDSRRRKCGAENNHTTTKLKGESE